jgi:uncharacterized membrane protein YciS (DUF1049 family)
MSTLFAILLGLGAAGVFLFLALWFYGTVIQQNDKAKAFKHVANQHDREQLDG